MNLSEHLDQQIKDILLMNGGDININEYPHIVREAEELGINQPGLAKKIRIIYDSIDWRPYHAIDRQLESIILKGSISEAEALSISRKLEKELTQTVVINYILSTIKKRGFLPREKHSFEHDSLKNRWMTNEAWEQYQRNKVVVEWLDEEAHSLDELGEISFRKPDDAKYYLRNTNFLVPSITTLTRSASRADEFARIIDGESNPEIRYLKIIYSLKPSLPFRIGDEQFSDIHSLLAATAMNYSLFTATADAYARQQVHIWIYEADKSSAKQLTPGYDYNSFLQFVYGIMPSHPFYLDSIRFDTPALMMAEMQQHAYLWLKLAAVITNGQLYTWFTSTGHADWVQTMKSRGTVSPGLLAHNEEEEKLAEVQQLILTVSPGQAPPAIAIDQQKLILPAIEGSSVLHHQLKLTLATPGFVKARVYIENGNEAIGVSQPELLFWSQNNVNEQTLQIRLDAPAMVKNKNYTVNIVTETLFQKITVPVEATVVFPRRAYIFQVVKYAVFGAVLLALARWVTGAMAADEGWFGGGGSARFGIDGLPENYFAYFVGLLLLVIAFTGFIRLIRKMEKI